MALEIKRQTEKAYQDYGSRKEVSGNLINLVIGWTNSFVDINVYIQKLYITQAFG